MSSRFSPHSFLFLAGALTLAACHRDPVPDAYGTFEAEDVVVSAQTSGQLRRFDVVEGQQLDRDARVAVIDTVQLALERDQAVAQRRSLTARRAESTDRLEALTVQHQIAERAWQRTQRLLAAKAATATQADQAEQAVRVLTTQLSGARAATRAVDAELGAVAARIAQLDDRLADAVITNPVTGTVLTTYVRAGEVIQPGQALYAIAPLDTLTLRTYVSGDQLTSFRIGDEVTVRVDGPTGLQSHSGVITWVSDRAEFTPTPVQTRDERATLVYAVKVRVANPDGRLKIGMPADVTLPSGSQEER